MFTVCPFSGETLAYTHWAPKSPNSTGPGCATYVTDNVNAWVDELCDKPLPFLCQIGRVHTVGYYP